MAIASIRKLIVAAIIAQLKTITIANDYNTELASNVVEWLTANVAVDTLPGIEVKDVSETAEVRGTFSYRTLDIDLVGRMATGSIDAARNLLTDITVAMKEGPAYPVNVFLSFLTDMPDLTPEQQKDKVIKFTVSYEIQYRIAF